MKLEQFLSKEQDLLILLLCLTGIKIKVPLTDDNNQSRLRVTSLDLIEQEIEEIYIYDKDLEMINDQLSSIGYVFSHKADDRCVFRKKSELNKIHEFEVGDIAELVEDYAIHEAGTLCFVYEDKSSGKKNGISLISIDGVNLGTFSTNQQVKFLKFIRYSGYDYSFRNAFQLKVDYQHGYFFNAFNT